MSLKAKIEAVLYLTDKPLRAQAIAGIVGEEVQVVRVAILELIREYEERQGGLEIADEDGYSFQVRDQFANLMDEFLPIEMSAAQLRTLSAIAIKQPIAQSEIIRIRGAGAYDHIKELVLRGLVTKREDEKLRSPLLSTTKQFQEYFRLTKDGKSLRSYLKREMKKKDKADEPTDGSNNPEADLNDMSFEPGESHSETGGLEQLVRAESNNTVVAAEAVENISSVLSALTDESPVADEAALAEASEITVKATPAVELEISTPESLS